MREQERMITYAMKRAEYNPALSTSRAQNHPARLKLGMEKKSIIFAASAPGSVFQS